MVTSGLISRTAGLHGAKRDLKEKSRQRQPHPENGAEVVDWDQTVREVADLRAQLETATLALRRVLELLSLPKPIQLNLTPREMDTLGQLALIRSNGEIAREFRISENTVKYHMKNLFKKLRVRNRGQAIMVARALVLDLTRSGRTPDE